MEEPGETVRRRPPVVRIVLVALIVALLLGVEAGNRTSTWGSQSLTSAVNAENGQRVFRARTALVLGLDDRSLTEEIVAGIADWIGETSPRLVVETHVLGEAPFVPREGEALPDLFVLVEVLEHRSRWLPFKNSDDVRVHLNVGRTPRRCMDLPDSPFYSLACEMEIEGSTTFWGLSRPGAGQRAVVLEEVHERWDFLMEDVEIDVPNGGAEVAELAPLPPEAAPPFRLAGVTRPVYRGRRADGTYEALWDTDTNGSFTRAIEGLVQQAGADGWSDGGGHRSVESRPIAVELVREGERVQVLPARFEGNVRENADAPDTLTLVYRRDG